MDGPGQGDDSALEPEISMRSGLWCAATVLVLPTAALELHDGGGGNPPPRSRGPQPSWRKPLSFAHIPEKASMW